jgi:hypothetical protein
MGNKTLSKQYSQQNLPCILGENSLAGLNNICRGLFGLQFCWACMKALIIACTKSLIIGRRRMSCEFVSMVREWWSTSVRSWPMDWRSQVTSYICFLTPMDISMHNDMVERIKLLSRLRTSTTCVWYVWDAYGVWYIRRFDGWASKPSSETVLWIWPQSQSQRIRKLRRRRV